MIRNQHKIEHCEAVIVSAGMGKRGKKVCKSFQRCSSVAISGIALFSESAVSMFFLA